MMINFCITFIFMKHPISLGLILLLQTILTSMLMNSLIMNAWFSYIMLLIMIGGLLILFIYMTSLMANEKFKFNPLILFMNLGYLLIIMMIYFIDKFNYTLLVNSTSMFMYNLNMNFNKFLMSNSMIMLIMIIYLLMVMIAVVKISSFKSGPLRQKF
uniref:NADH dehydrogenase subunit 6 n=1 Tax=Anotylus hirtulus TaxID=3078928 RepID=UPI002A82BBD8|nr:NADH dehydrogenase subunit 6 [Anotylus hirtulus]WON65975.1 NADH dehydrogenase subunit 6 [Anotylus hirtulus]